MATSPDNTSYYARQYSGLGSVGSYQVAGTLMTGSTIAAGDKEIITPKCYKIYYYYQQRR